MFSSVYVFSLFFFSLDVSVWVIIIDLSIFADSLLLLIHVLFICKNEKSIFSFSYCFFHLQHFCLIILYFKLFLLTFLICCCILYTFFISDLKIITKSTVIFILNYQSNYSHVYVISGYVSVNCFFLRVVLIFLAIDVHFLKICIT